jgi:hypothetical protein
MERIVWLWRRYKRTLPLLKARIQMMQNQQTTVSAQSGRKTRGLALPSILEHQLAKLEEGVRMMILCRDIQSPRSIPCLSLSSRLSSSPHVWESSKKNHTYISTSSFRNQQSWTRWSKIMASWTKMLHPWCTVAWNPRKTHRYGNI